MGVDLGDLAVKHEIEMEDLTGRKIGIDALNIIYQFVTIIRQQDGSPLRDSEGRVTSHLSGLFYRTIKMLQKEIKPSYVFDGEPPELKAETVAKRKKKKTEAREKREEALEEGDMEKARKYAVQGSKVTEEMLHSARDLLEVMGVPYVQAPSEGEAQAAYMASEGDVWGVYSQDYDALLFGAPRLLRNLAIRGKRKLPGKQTYVEVSPERIDLEETLGDLGLDREKLVIAGILAGTDFNPGGFKGIGPKRSLKRAREAKNLRGALEGLDWAWDSEPEEIFDFFMDPPTTDEYSLEWREPDRDGIRELLIEKHDFSEKRVNNAIERLEESKDRQGRLEEFT